MPSNHIIQNKLDKTNHWKQRWLCSSQQPKQGLDQSWGTRSQCFLQETKNTKQLKTHTISIFKYILFPQNVERFLFRTNIKVKNNQFTLKYSREITVMGKIISESSSLRRYESAGFPGSRAAGSGLWTAPFSPLGTEEPFSPTESEPQSDCSLRQPKHL